MMDPIEERKEIPGVSAESSKSEEEKNEVRKIMSETKELIKQLRKIEFPKRAGDNFVKFEPILSWRWKLEIDGIDYFLVKKVEFPKYVRQSGDDLHAILKKQRNLTVYLYEAVAPATYQQVEEMVLQTSIAPRNGTLKYVDCQGNAVRTRLFSGIRVDEAEYGSLDYESKKPLEIKLVLSYEAERLV